MASTAIDLTRWASELGLGGLLNKIRSAYGSYLLRAHWQQGEFHHDLMLEIIEPDSGVSRYCVVSTNCNGGVKEMLLFDQAITSQALWHWRCPENPEFSGQLPEIKQRIQTVHFFDPCEVLAPDARSEIRPEFRKRQQGGGWQLAGR